jgi:hypothetical protein
VLEVLGGLSETFQARAQFQELLELALRAQELSLAREIQKITGAGR